MTDATLPSNESAVAEIVRHSDLLLESGDEVLSLTPDEWRKIRKAIGVDTDLLKSVLAEAFDWLCPPKGVGAAGDALREYLLRILPLLDMSTNTVLGKSASAHETLTVDSHMDRLQNERLTWGMACPCSCDACERFYDVIRAMEDKQMDARPVCPQCGQINGFHRETCPLRHSLCKADTGHDFDKSGRCIECGSPKAGEQQ